MDISSNLQMLDYMVIAFYIISVMGLGFYISFTRRESEDLFLAGRSLGWFNVGLSIFGTNISPNFMIAGFGIAYSTGMVTGNFEWLAWIFLLLLAMVFTPHYLNTKISTMPEFMSKRYGNRCRNFLSWYTLVSTLVIWLGGTLYAGGLLLGQILNWPLWLSATVLIVIATSFTVAGGLAAVVITDTFQSILMIVASTALAIIGLVKVGGFSGLYESLDPGMWTLFKPANDPEWPWTAILLGYPILGIWFWCTDQTIVQRVLGARDLKQGQLGAIFAAFLKIITPLIFYLPGMVCRVLHPDLSTPDLAYMTMVTNYLPVGMVGLIVAVLIAALISTVDSGLNSLSTVFTLDIYKKMFVPEATPKHTKFVGRIVTVAGSVLAIAIALSLESIKDMDLFSIFQSLIAFMSPPMAAVFLIGVLWKRANSTAAFLTLVVGSALCLGVGGAYLATQHKFDWWPNFMLLAFYLFVILAIHMIFVSLMTPAEPEKALPSIRSSYEKISDKHRSGIWMWWIILAVIMFAIYIGFQLMGMRLAG